LVADSNESIVELLAESNAPMEGPQPDANGWSGWTIRRPMDK
jgi:hypothetical protein